VPMSQVTRRRETHRSRALSAIRSHLCLPVSVFLLVLAGLLVSPAPARAQAPVVPDSPEIVGYLYLLDPHALDQRLPALWQAMGVEEMMPSLSGLLAGWAGDDKLRLATPQQAVLVVFLRGEDGAIRDVVVFPEAGSPNYLSSSAQKRDKEGVTDQGTSVIGSKEAVAQARKIMPALKKLREATHPADVSLYLRDGLWKGRMSAILAFLSAPDLGAIKPLLNLPEQQSTIYVPLAVAKSTPAAKAKAEVPFGLQVIGRVFQDVETIHLALESNLSPCRLTLSISPTSGTPLARLLNQPAPSPLTEILYLPEGGSLRAGASFDMDALDSLIHEAVLAAGQENSSYSPEQLEQIYDRYTRPLILKGNGSVYMNEGGMAVFTQCLNFSCAEWLRGAIRNSDFANYQTDDLLARVDRAFPSTKPKADGKPQPVAGVLEYITVVTPRAGRKDLQRIEAMLSEAPKDQPKPEINLVLRNARAEEFTIDQFFPKSQKAQNPNQPIPPDQAILSACRLGNYLVLTSRFEDMKSTLNRILRLDPLTAPLEAQKIFLDGALAYADLRLPGNKAAATNKTPPAPAAGAAPTIRPTGRAFLFTARTGDGALQITAALP
jgi:hypothetical protein